MAGNYLSRDQILAQPIRTVDVEAFGGKLCVRELDSLTLQELYDSDAFKTDEDGNTEVDFSKLNMARIAARCIVDPATLEPVLSLRDVQELARKSGFVILTIASKALEISGFAQEEAEPEKN